MAVIRVQATLPRDTLMAVDDVVNTWHFTTASGDVVGRAAETALALVALKQFYTTAGANFGNTMTGAVNYKAYDLAEAEPRVPFIIDASTFTPAANAYPSEVALTLSFQGVPVSGETQARRRGRVFTGVYSSGSGTPVDGGIRPSGAVITNLVNAADALLTASDSAAEWSWIVFSPTAAGPELADGTYTNLSAGVTVVEEGWVDNAFDTIRSRGLAATTKTTFS